MASFIKFIPIVHEKEGGYQDHPSDLGNYNSLGQLVGTNFGISAKTYERWIGYPPSVFDMKNMTKTIANEIYEAWYWQPMRASEYKNQSIANILVDHGVNAGIGNASKLIQKVLNNSFNKNLAIDGKVGTLTISALNSVNQNTLFEAIKKARIDYYKSLGTTFLPGWINRVNSFFFLKTEIS